MVTTGLVRKTQLQSNKRGYDSEDLQQSAAIREGCEFKKSPKISHLDENGTPKEAPPSHLQKDIFSSRKHGMDYFTVDGLILRTGYQNKREWYLLPIKEMLDNDVDFLWKFYKGAENVSITVNVAMDDDLFHLTVRNSNYKNITVFSNLEPIFDYEMRYGSKQDVYIISRGMLGDAMKQILSLGYVLLHTADDGTAFVDKQWEHPLILRYDKKEWKIYLDVDKARQSWQVRYKKSSNEVMNTDTEIELTLPVIGEVRNTLNRKYVEQFCRKYSIPTTDISFKFRIVDDINHTHLTEEEVDDANTNMQYELAKALTTDPERGIMNIDVSALHPIAAERQWSNSDSIWSCKPEEFIRRIENVHDKDSTSIYDVLLAFSREGSEIRKSAENNISVAEFLSKPNKEKRIEELFKQLRKVRLPSKDLSLPYTSNTKKRADALVTRIATLYDIDREKKPSYRLVRGSYRDNIIEYPFVFEIIAIPLKNPFMRAIKSTEIITAVNYSVSPRDNTFEGNYRWYDDKNAGYHHAKNFRELVDNHGFHSFYGPKSRLPCIIVANLITPRRDPLGHDKSSIDTQPSIKTIATAVYKMASGIQTNRAAGYRFQEANDYSTARRHDINTKVSVRSLLKQFLIDERGLPT